jgi:hypothetical protein
MKKTIQKACDAIGGLTPVSGADCGKLCGKICCKGDVSGMLLFPGEEEIFRNIPGFSIEEIEYMGVPNIKLLMCEKLCERAIRPLACRIFPVAPAVDESGNVRVRPDIRGRRMCPLWDLENVDKKFIKAVAEAFGILAANKKTLALLRLISAEIDELERFYKK